jgi:hypothetical protein
MIRILLFFDRICSISVQFNIQFEFVRGETPVVENKSEKNKSAPKMAPVVENDCMEELD